MDSHSLSVAMSQNLQACDHTTGKCPIPEDVVCDPLTGECSPVEDEDEI